MPLTVLEVLSEKAKDGCFMCLVKCHCGKIKKINKSKIKYQKSCGCLVGKAGTHLLTKHPIFARYKTMLARCYNPANKSYHLYGGRGIRISERWMETMPTGFLNFLEDMGLPSENQSLDRIDNDGNYEKSNCRWTDVVVQANNKRSVKKIQYGEDFLSASEIARKNNLNIARFKYYYRKYKDVEKAIAATRDVLRDDNKTGELNITYRVGRRTYVVMIKGFSNKSFKTLQEAVNYRDSIYKIKESNHERQSP
jgi:hypothetical protein